MSRIGEHLISGLLDGLTALVKDEVTMLWGVKGEIEQLQTKFLSINAILADAERKKIQSEAINLWLKKLKDIMFDADDILDECRTEVVEKSKVAVSSGHQPCSPGCSFLTSVCDYHRLLSCSCFGKIAFAHQIGRRIKDLNRRLDDIKTEIPQFGLQPSSARLDDHQSTSRVSRKSSSIPEPDIVGSNIEKDTEKLVELLIKKDTRENILVYSIVGIGGIGKTTLARNVFNDENITANFLMKRWVCVSKDFEETSLLREIIGVKEGRDRSRAQLEIEVQNSVANKKFLLVLDDLWDAKVWNELLRNPLQGAAAGSRVLMTTRNEGVALQMKAVAPLHKVELLSADDGWALLRKKVVLSGEEREVEDLKDIGKKIVDRCGGLPLSIKTIGGVLATKSTNKKDWEIVLRNLSNNASTPLKEVHPALFLSYEDLPSHLKQCFLYCSLFPEDYLFNRQQLIRYWISEGFVHEEGEGGLTLEELGEDYFWDLVQRSFFQHLLSDEIFIVHDLHWSLARTLAGDENLVMKDGVELVLDGSSPVKSRRIQSYYVGEEKQQAFIDALKGHDSVRTLLIGLINESMVERNYVNNLIKKTPRLRVLCLFPKYFVREENIRKIKLSKSLGGLIHLRFLQLSLFQVSEVPASIGNLVNLQFLILTECYSLRSLPRSIVFLHNLRCLELYGAKRLEGIPIEIADLHRLNTLINFVVRNNNNKKGLSTLQDLGSLENLRKLVISDLSGALNEGEVGLVNVLRNMKQLQELQLSCTYYSVDNEEEDIKRMEEIFEVMLCPPPHLESLIIKGFFNLHYPSWIAPSSTDLLLFGLRRLILSGSCNCPNLPSLGKLPNLDYLEIEGASTVKKIGTEFLGQEADSSRDGQGRMQISFPKLITLIFSRMPKWEEWEWEVKDDDRLIVLPNLKKLVLDDCSNLRSLPSGLVRHATTLTNLKISYCHSLKAAIRGFSSIKELEIIEGRNLDDVSDLPSLKTMFLEDRNMQSLPEWFDEGGHNFPALHNLEIVGSDQLVRRCLKDGLDWPKIEHIPYVLALAQSPFPAPT